MADINGTNAPDVLAGTTFADVIRGWNPLNAPGDEGPDTDADLISAGDGSDTVFGGGGDDEITGGGTGPDSLVGGEGDDTLYSSISPGEAGNDASRRPGERRHPGLQR